MRSLLRMDWASLVKISNQSTNLLFWLVSFGLKQKSKRDGLGGGGGGGHRQKEGINKKKEKLIFSNLKLCKSQMN